jgi:hypothetical protein
MPDRRDVLDDDPPDVDVILAGDCWYDATLATRVLPWLQGAGAAGIAVIVGDPGRRYLPTDALVELAVYKVRTSTELEDLDHKEGRAYALRPADGGARGRGAHDIANGVPRPQVAVAQGAACQRRTIAHAVALSPDEHRPSRKSGPAA